MVAANGDLRGYGRWHDARHRGRWPATAREIAAVFAEVELDLSGADEAWGYDGGRPLDRLVEDAR